MKKLKIIALFLPILSIFIMSACTNYKTDNSTSTSSQSQNDKKEQETWTYRGVKFSVPKDWEHKESDDKDTNWFYPSYGILQIQAREFDGNFESAFVRKIFKTGLESHERIITRISNEKETSINGKTFFIYDFTYKDDKDAKMTGKMFVFTHNHHLFSFMLGAYDDANKDYLEDFETLFDSITLEKAETSTSSSSWESSSESKTKKEKASPWNKDTMTLTTSEGVLKIDRIERASDYEGKPTIKVYFTLTNKSSREQYAQLLYLKMVKVKQLSENTSNDLQYAISSFDDQEDNHLQDTILPNGTISGVYSYNLEDETHPVVFQFEENYSAVALYTYDLQ